MTSIETNTVVKKSGPILLALLLAVGLTACDLTEGFDEDPNAPGDAPATKVLNSAEVGAILFQDGNHARLTSMFTEQLNGADRQYAGQDRPQYGLTATDVEAVVPVRVETDLRERLPDFGYAPFGGGPRRCIGRQFALLEATLALATVGREYDLRWPDDPDADPPLVGVTSAPEPLLLVGWWDRFFRGLRKL